MKKLFLILTVLTFAACMPPIDAPPPPTAIPSDTPLPALTSTPTVSASPSPAPAFCGNPRGTELIASLRTAVQTEDGKLLASLVSPTLGMDVRFFRDGNVVNYDVEHAPFVFETTFQADWGLHFASGEPTIGAFQEIILPSLQQIFSADAEIICNELKTGGATYIPEWLYPGMDFYSVHFPGSEQYGGLDWQTWAVGMSPVDGALYITALSHFVWEP
ncbi:MAG TPA: hypothetical protein PLF42_14165 [Anaerolineales bacterium]|nr:hypothetical protein [Anaerolineales bacterium]